MKIHWNIEQGTEAWLKMRSQYIPSSESNALVTPTGKISTAKGVQTFANKIIAQRLTGEPVEGGFDTFATRRGKELEPEARSYYEFATGLKVSECGLVTNGETSCSPDGLIMDGNRIIKGLEIKCPFATTHVGYCLDGTTPSDYKHQVQSSMVVCEVDEWDFLSYHPKLEQMIITVQRDEQWIEAYQEALKPFIERIEDGITQLTKKAA